MWTKKFGIKAERCTDSKKILCIDLNIAFDGFKELRFEKMEYRKSKWKNSITNFVKNTTILMHEPQDHHYFIIIITDSIIVVQR
jgi:hypothetical protein